MPNPSAPSTPAVPASRGGIAVVPLAGPRLGRAFAAGALAAAAAYGVALGLIGPEQRLHAGLGVGAALAAVGLALLLHGRVLGRVPAGIDRDPRLLAGRLQGLLGAALGLKLAVVTLGVLALRATDVKFPQVTAFAVAFAATALVCQVTTAVVLVRDLSRAPRGPAAPGVEPTTGTP